MEFIVETEVSSGTRLDHHLVVFPPGKPLRRYAEALLPKEREEGAGRVSSEVVAVS